MFQNDIILTGAVREVDNSRECGWSRGQREQMLDQPQVAFRFYLVALGRYHAPAKGASPTT